VVRAAIHTLNGFSAHAGQTELLDWLSCVAPHKPRILLTHGEPQAMEPLAQLIDQRYGLKPEIPEFGMPVEL